MDTYFSSVTGADGSNCSQVLVGLASRMINVYPMPSKASGHIYKAYQDFMRYEGVPECLHHDLAPEQKVDDIINLNRDIQVRDSYSEAGYPNQNPAESLGVKVIKKGAEVMMDCTGIDEKYWPWVHKYIADVNNHCATPFLNWEVPITKRHGYIPDISPLLQYQLNEKIYYKVDEKCPNSQEKAGYWMGISHTVGDILTYDILTDDTKNIIQQSVLRPADPK